MNRRQDISLHSNGQHWQAAWYDRAGKRQRKNLGSKQAVSKFVAERMCRELAAKMIVSPDLRESGEAVPLKVWLDRYQELRRDDLSRRSKTLFLQTSRLLLEYLAPGMPLDRVSPSDADDWAVRLKGKGLSARTVHGHVIRARAMFERARKRRIIVTNPFEDVTIRVPRSAKQWHNASEREIRTLMAAAEPGLRCLIALCAFAGLRLHEALNVKRSDVAFADRRIFVWPKGGVETTRTSAREVRLEPELAKILKAAWAEHDATNPASRWKDQAAPTSPRNVHRRMSGGSIKLGAKVDGSPRVSVYKGLFAKAGVTPWAEPFRVLRRWRDQTWKAAGWPEFIVDGWLGHSLEVSREHYLRAPDWAYDSSPALPPATRLPQSRPAAGGKSRKKA